ncbi:MAG: hypothetical protein Fur0037_11440 [Planctomycetota bacterium]
MIRVQVRPNEPLEAALRRFKRQCNYAGIFRLAKKYAYHEKASDKNRREERERLRNIQRAERRSDTSPSGRGGRARKRRVRSSSVTLESARAEAAQDFDPLTVDTRRPVVVPQAAEKAEAATPSTTE